jgi:hypothetical protein
MSNGKMTDIVLPERRQTDGMVGAQGKDFSGLDFVELGIEGQNFFESIFNGCLFEDLRASQSVFQHAEFTEAKFSNCTFEDTSFDHSDFVLSEINRTEFARCSFQNAEWRDTVFNSVTFRQCIFRNTTTSLAQFVNCSFDGASAASFVGASKRFSLFSQTEFFLPRQHVDFLRFNFGISSQDALGAGTHVDDDPLFQMSLYRYSRELGSQRFYELLLKGLSRTINDSTTPHRLRMGYLRGICKVVLDEKLLSVFSIQLLDDELSRMVALFKDRDQILELMGLILTLRVTLREKVEAVEKEVSDLQDPTSSRLRVSMQFEKTYSRETIEDYAAQLASYCGLSQGQVVIQSVRQGSTIAEISIAAAAFIPDVLRFVKYSLSFATVTLVQASKLRDAYRLVKAAEAKPAKAIRTIKPKESRATSQVRSTTPTKSSTAEIATRDLLNTISEDTKPIEIFVDRVRERVLIVDGRVTVSITVI